MNYEQDLSVFFTLFHAHIHTLLFAIFYFLPIVLLTFSNMHLRNLALFYELYGYPNERNMSLLQEEDPNERNMSLEQEENVDNMKSSKVSTKRANKATGKTKMTKEERSRLMEEKKLLKEVGFSLYCLVFTLYIIPDFDHNSL
jgi:hypothetical protein